MAKSFAEHMADTMPGDDYGADDGEELDSSDHDAAGHKAMEDLSKHLKDGDFEAAWQCFKDAQGIADKAEDEETSPAAEEDDMPVPGGHGGGHAALLLMPRGK